MSKMEIINIEAGRPTVEEAIRRMNMGLATARGRGAKAAKIIHGYGSSGVGGGIRPRARAELQNKRRMGRLKAVIAGEDFSSYAVAAREAVAKLPWLQQDSDYGRRNDGVTIVLF
ncbi:hypothetical protein [Zongyangia hominis]|uniref:Uncharacterized protein n=1 Tax=Zongyangia hominis TaxID=2763677 RepID=A0A926IC46_9FIRM|nr:hypothetical protein [Zongyangia hominis]MBC8570842.1 hypothetical protein [Zongyangia hominis]